jgi:DNA-binding YbaB/EbfC family protein
MFGDIGKLMKLAGDMKRKMPEMQARLAATEYSAEVGGGMVHAVVNGKFQLIDLKIAPQALAAGDIEVLQDLIKAAVSAAQTKAAQAAQSAMKELTGGITLPGMEGLMS